MKLEASELLERLYEDISCLDEDSQLRLLTLWLHDLRLNHKLFKKTIGILFQSGHRPKRTKAERWMEKQYLRERLGPKGINGLKPRELAEKYLKTARLDLALLPYFTRLARKVKHKVYMRITREYKKDGQTKLHVPVVE